VRAFLDANVLFSAALGGEGFALLWGLAERGAVELVTSSYCYLEARVNLERKAPTAADRLGERMRVVGLVGPGAEYAAWAVALLPEKDAAVPAAARAAGADVLLTGDLRRFGSLMNQADLPLLVTTVRSFLLQGAPWPERSAAPSTHSGAQSL
jgi:predicted nucleic acid-binding protein